MKTKTNYQQILDFQAAVDSVPVEPLVPSEAILQLRHTLIREEYEEVSEAIAELTAVSSNDPSALTDLAHELADLLYVVYGTFAAIGVDADAVFAEVHRANMTKLEGPRRADGKLLKPPGWQPANVAGVIEGGKQKVAS
jgi:predicted HAD superfamily Cof-like phosphohydrolase